MFDFFPGLNTQMSSSQISQDANRYDAVWGSFNPAPWRAANQQALVSRYYIVTEDNLLVSGNNLQYFQQNHPDWIMYACDSNGNPTKDYAYTPGDGFQDVPLNIHNPQVVQYQLGTLLAYVKANNYNAMALDEVIFNNFMLGGNPELGQTKVAGEYGCGTYNTDGSFNRVYTGTKDPTFTSDILNWVAQARAVANGNNLSIIVNHPAGSTTDANEQRLLSNVDVTMSEAGFTDYGSVPASYYGTTYRYAEWVQQQGKAMIVIDKYDQDRNGVIPNSHVEYSLATYLLTNEGNLDLFVVGHNSAGYGYGAEQYHAEYGTNLGKPCAAAYGGPSYDPANPQIYYRRYQNGMAIINSGSAQTESAKLPSNHTYNDIEGQAVTNPLPVASGGSYVLLTGGGTGCQ